MTEQRPNNSEMGDYPREEWQLRQEKREENTLTETANEIDKRAQKDPVDALRWLAEKFAKMF